MIADVVGLGIGLGRWVMGLHDAVGEVGDLGDSIAFLFCFFVNVLWRKSLKDSLVDGLELGRFDGGLDGGWVIGVDEL